MQALDFPCVPKADIRGPCAAGSAGVRLCILRRGLECLKDENPVYTSYTPVSLFHDKNRN
jgi:hypothetical protein